jgi:tetratricopeptide (TPR) repeat protein
VSGLAIALALGLAAGAPAAPPDRDALRAGAEEVRDQLESWHVPAARKTAEELQKRYGHSPATEELLGEVLFFEGDYAGAAKLLGEEGDYGKLAAASVAELRDYDQRESAHFILRFPKGRSELLAPYALDTLEKAYQAIGQDLHELPAEKVRIEILRDTEALSHLSPLTEKEIRDSGTIALCKFNKLMVTSPQALLTGYSWQDTLAHEYTHYLIQRRSDGTVPIWLHEGIAKFEETRWRGAPGQAMSPASMALLARRLRENRLITFAQMHPSMALLPTQEDATLAFAEVATAVRYLYEEKGGAAALNRLIDKLRAGEEDSAAVAEVAGESFAAFQKDWKTFLRGLPMPKEVLPLERLRFRDADAHEGKGKSAGKAGDKSSEKSSDVGFEDLADIGDEQAKRFAELGELLRARRRTAASVVEYAKAEARVGASSPQLSNKYAVALLETNQPAKAETLLKASVVPFPDIAQTHLHLGEAYLSEQHWAEAREELLRANAVDPFDPQIHLGLMKADQQLGDKPAYETEARAVGLLTGGP